MTDSWLRLYLQYTAKHEAPELFHFWNGIGMLSSALGRRVFLNRGNYVIYPNFFIVLVAGSALCRKTTSISMATELLEDLPQVKVIDGKIASVERFIQELYFVGPNDTLPPAALVSADELSVFLTRDPAGERLIDVITKLFDMPKVFPYRRITGGGDVLIREPFLSIIAGTTTEKLGKNLPDTAFGGGSASRFIFVYQEDAPKSRRKLWPEIDELEKIELRRRLVGGLREVFKYHGAFVISEEAKEFTENWYDKLEKPEDRRLDGFVGRIHDHMLRIAMVLCASQLGPMVIQKQHAEAAIVAIEQVQQLLPQAFGDIGRSDFKDHSDRVLQLIHRGGLEGTSHSYILRKMYGFIDGAAFRVVVSTLLEQQHIARKADKHSYYVCLCDSCEEQRKAIRAKLDA